MAVDTEHWFKYGDTLWNSRRKASNWHFDPELDDTNHPGIIMNPIRFEGDWADEISNTQFTESACLDLSQYLVRVGYQEYLNLDVPADIEGKRATVDPAIHPKIQKIVDSFKLRDPYAQIIYQKPGEMFPLHIDVLCTYGVDSCQINSMDDIELDMTRTRLFVTLDDWRWGQFLVMGNYNWTQWKAGDVMWFDWHDMPHASANAGHFPRPMLKLTGFKTPEFEQVLKSNGTVINV